MTNSQAQEFMNTVQLVPGENAPTTAQVDAALSAAAAPSDADIWPEAADFQCSQSAALFAGTLPAPLSVV